MDNNRLGPANRPPTASQRIDLFKRNGSGGLVLAVVIGLQLGALPWGFRRQMFQLQAALAGGLVGFVVGWGIARGRRESRNDDQ